jgi:3-methylcrotonyl-CoA carboxylase alpha subunit
MFDKILIANRGEIACRIIKTAWRMGIQTVAVYSDADADSRHVRMADEAVRIAAAPAKESYLAARSIITAATRTGAEAIHPGYGFLSENEDFCHACGEAGLVFIGPPAGAIRAMGSKSEAKKLMGAAKVPLVPGYHGDNQHPACLRKEADAIGYPVLIKAAAGGGGKGMRLVECPEDFEAALESCKREAASSFGNDHVLVEKYIARPRHIEIQVFADSLGNCVSLFERDCSVQRRHQKVLEEAPAPGMTLERRRQMGEAAVAAAKAVKYVGAGTVEFIATQDGVFYFMEMNTRLQVEHPVTEMITGLDLVEWQLRVASGEALPLTQEQLQINGHALEARIYAEDPAKGFLPSAGKLTHLTPPKENLHVRIDTGVEEGDSISPFYDPMIAKLIVWDMNRERARARMLQALADYRVVGVSSNIGFLSRLVACPAFAGADLDTGLIERERAYLFSNDQTAPAEVFLVAALAEVLREAQRGRDEAGQSPDPKSPWHIRDGWRLNAADCRMLCFRQEDAQKTIHVSHQPGGFLLRIEDHEVAARGGIGARGQMRAELGGVRMDAVVIAAGGMRHVFLHGRTWQLASVDPLFFSGDLGGAQAGLLAPMPGKVIALLAEPGTRVEKGAALLVLEAMKMEHTISAPSAGCVRAFRFAAGDLVMDGAELVDFEPAQR